MSETADEFIIDHTKAFHYPAMSKTLGGFKLNVEPGNFSDSEIIVMLGENGTGKSTFVKMLAGKLAPDAGQEIPQLSVSMKPQMIAPKFPGTVRMLLIKQIKASFLHPQFNSDVLKPMQIEDLLDQEVQTLSGGELQRVAIVLALGKPADVYLLDEPSSHLDVEQRVNAAKVIKRFIMHSRKSAMVIEHDFLMATYLADRVVVFSGEPAVEATARAPQSLLTGMNDFLRELEVSYRRDPENYRPRVNKYDSVKDREQKAEGKYFFLEE